MSLYDQYNNIYGYVSDGRLLCHCFCQNCGEQREVHPTSNYQPLCDACTQVAKRMSEKQEKS